MGVGLSVSIERRVERLKKPSGSGNKSGGDVPPRDPVVAWCSDPHSAASLPAREGGSSNSSGNARILDNAKDVKLENSNLIAVQGNMTNVTNIVTHNLNVVVPEDVLYKIVAWVSVINYQDIQDDNLSKQIGETCMWVFDEPLFLEWVASDRGILWGTGIPGAGKTVLAAIIINYVRKRAETNKRILVAFAYCRYTDPLPIKAVLAAIIRQILEDYPSTIVFVKPLYDKHVLRNTRPTEGELVKVLTAIFTSDMFDQRFLFVDGLDEATCDTQFDILDTLSQLPLNALFTSRPLPLLNDSVPEAKFFDIIVRNADIERLIAEKVRSTKTLAKLLEQDSWRERVLKAVLEKSSGMLLVASLQLDILGGCLNIKELRVALDCLPKGVDEMYTATMRRIENQANPGMAKRTLTMLVFAFESLSIDDLRHAIAIDPVTSKYDTELLIDAESLLSICCGLITLEPQSKLVRLVHYTAKYFLIPHLRKVYPEPHALISSSCVARMVSCGFHNVETPQDLPALYSTEFRESPFLAYSYRQWATHSHSCTTVPPDAVDFILRCRCFPLYGFRGDYLDLCPSVHVAAIFNFHTLLREWFDQTRPGNPNPFPHQLNINALSAAGNTPLFYATSYGHIETVRTLLDVEAIDANGPNRNGITPLMHVSAYYYRPPRILELFWGVLDIKDINATDNEGRSALYYASYYGRLDAVKAILGFQSTRQGTTVRNDMRYGAGINVNGVTSIGTTALMCAAGGGHAAVVKELLCVKDIDVNYRSSRDFIGSALAYACRRGNSNVVQLLLEHGDIDINIASTSGKTALSWALEKKYEGIAELLRARGV